MAHNDTKFEITPAVIDFGERIVALRQVTTAGCRRGHPFRVLGIVLLLAALAGLAWEAWFGSGLSAIKTGGSTRLWVAFVVAGLAIFAIVYQRRTLLIRLADGSKIRLNGGSNEFQERVVACIGEALEADAGSPFHAVVDMLAQSIETGAAAATSRSWQPATTDGVRSPAMTNGSANGKTDATRSLPHERMAGMPHGAARNGHAPPRDSLEARIDGANQGAMGGMPGRWSAPPSGAVAGMGAGEPMPRIVPQQAEQRPLREPSPPLRDMEMLLDFVRRSDVQHKAALLELLAVVEDYLKGGGTVREDAASHWLSFSGYVHQYLTSVEGLVPLTDRAGRPFATN